MSNFEEAHVLAVDDSSVDRMLLEHLLRNSSCKVTSVDSGLGAMQLLGVEGLKVDMIITDYCMPDMTGYELLKKIKESSDFKEIPIVIMSSENVLTRKEKCLEEGAKDFLLKPVKFSDLKRLKDYMKKDGGINQRKLLESYDQSSSPPSILPQTSSLSSPSPPLSLTSSFSALSSPTSLDSQNRTAEKDLL